MTESIIYKKFRRILDIAVLANVNLELTHAEGTELLKYMDGLSTTIELLSQEKDYYIRDIERYHARLALANKRMIMIMEVLSKPSVDALEEMEKKIKIDEEERNVTGEKST